MCIDEVMAAGPEAVAKRTAVMGEFAGLIDENARTLLKIDEGDCPQCTPSRSSRAPTRPCSG